MFKTNDFNEFIELAKNYKVICFIGSGGKTTTIFKLAEHLKNDNNFVLITTTTKMSSEFIKNLKLVSRETINTNRSSSIQLLSKKIHNKKIIGEDSMFIDSLSRSFDYILIEGDGSRKKSLKAYGVNEPVIPLSTELVVACFSIDILGRIISDDTIFRCDIFLKCISKDKFSRLGIDDIVKFIVSPKGLFGFSGELKKVILITKVNNKEKLTAFKMIKNKVGLVDEKIKLFYRE